MICFKSFMKKIGFYLSFILVGLIFWQLWQNPYPKSFPSYVGQDVSAQTLGDWPMAGHDPARSSWSAENVRPNTSSPVCTKVIGAFIPHKVQIIGSGDLIYVSAADGVHALNYATCQEVWWYKTEMPVGHSPTIANGKLYVGVYDKKIHALNAATGARLWTFSGEAGFDNNPVVVNDRLYTGGRDGYFYALDANSGSLIWKYKAESGLSFSPAYKDGVLYFGDRDGRAYALKDNGSNYQLVWKTAPLSGAGFTSYWPVIFGDRVIFSGGHHYGYGRTTGGNSDCGQASVVNGKPTMFERCEAWPAGSQSGDLFGPALGEGWIDASVPYNYLRNKPWRQTIFVLNRATGALMETPPVIWQGNASTETRAPAVYHGIDGLAYFYQSIVYESAIPWARVTGWRPSTPSQLYVPCVYQKGVCGEAADKPGAIAAGGNYIYIKTNRGRNVYYVDVTNGTTGKISISNNNPAYSNFKYGMLADINDTHGLQNPPTPFRGRIYFHSFNTVYAY